MLSTVTSALTIAATLGRVGHSKIELEGLALDICRVELFQPVGPDDGLLGQLVGDGVVLDDDRCEAVVLRPGLPWVTSPPPSSSSLFLIVATSLHCSPFGSPCAHPRLA